MDSKATKDSYVLAFAEDLLDIERLARPKGCALIYCSYRLAFKCSAE
jgi:hypothetical protein